MKKSYTKENFPHYNDPRAAGALMSMYLASGMTSTTTFAESIGISNGTFMRYVDTDYRSRTQRLWTRIVHNLFRDVDSVPHITPSFGTLEWPVLPDGDFLKVIRMHFKKSPAEFAKMLGVSTSTIVRYEDQKYCDQLIESRDPRSKWEYLGQSVNHLLHLQAIDELSMENSSHLPSALETWAQKLLKMKHTDEATLVKLATEMQKVAFQLNNKRAL